MANIRVRIKNTRDLDAMLPKLKRSLTVQHNIELEEEGEGKGVFLLVVKEAIQLKQFATIKKLLDSYGFEFFLRTVDLDGNEYDPEQDQQQPEPEQCECEVCRGMREIAKQQQDAMQQIADVAQDRRAERVRVRPIKPVPVEVLAKQVAVLQANQANQKLQKRAMQEKVAKELLEAVAKMKKDLARR